MLQPDIYNNEPRQQFQTQVDGQLASLEYRLHEGTMVLMHTEVPPALGGRGIGSALAEYALNYARTHHLPVKIYCPFVAAYVRRHPEHQDIIVKPD
jgi:predicted GNAT family acetyltransferase